MAVKKPDFLSISQEKIQQVNKREAEEAKRRPHKEKNLAEVNAAKGADFFQPPKSQKGSRLGNIFKGAAKSTASGFANAAGTALDLFQNHLSSEQNRKSRIEGHKGSRDYWQKELEKTKDPAKRAKIQAYIRQAEYGMESEEQQKKYEQRYTQKGVDTLQNRADKWAGESAEHIGTAKRGLGKAGQFAVDVGVAATQLGGDVALGALTGGSALVPMAVRGFGSSAQEARAGGASLEQQAAYGVGSAGLSLATEKISNATKVFSKAFGKGAADNFIDSAISKAVQRAAKTPAGKTALEAVLKTGAGFVGEGVEEFLEDVASPILKRATFDPNAKFDLEEAAYDFLVGGALGGLGGATDVMTSAKGTYQQHQAEAQQNANNAARERVYSTMKETGMFSPESAKAMQEAGYKPTESIKANTGGVMQSAAPAPVEEAAPVKAAPVAPQISTAEQKTAPVKPDFTVKLDSGERIPQSNFAPEQFQKLADSGDYSMDANFQIFKPKPEQHIDQRDAGDLGDRKINAFQFDHPELHDYFAGAASELLDEYVQAEKGGQIIQRGMYDYIRTKRAASPRIAALLDDFGMSYADIEKSLNAIINDKGQENFAAAKRAELILDDMLSNGYQSAAGYIPANQEYLRAKAEIPGAYVETETEGEELPFDDGLGAANAGLDPFSTFQGRADAFHPINEVAAQRTAEERGRSPEEVPTVNPNTGRNIEKAVSTILNSPLTSNEMAEVAEKGVVGGKFDYIKITDDRANRKAQMSLSRAGYEQIASDFSSKVDSGKVTKYDMAEAIAAYNQAVESKDHKTAFRLMVDISESAHTSAQVVQAMNMLNRMTPEGKLLTLRRFVDKMNRGNYTETSVKEDRATKEPGKANIQKEIEGVAVNPDLAAEYLSAETDKARDAAWNAILDDISQQLPPTFSEKANAWRYMSMLLNPTTHIRNSLGNGIQAGTRTIKNAVGAILEPVLVKDKAERTKAILTSSPEDISRKNLAKSMYDADMKAAMGEGKYQDNNSSGLKREIQDRRQAQVFGESRIGKAVQWVSDLNTNALDFEDKVFNKSAYVSALAQALKAKGITAEQAKAGGPEVDAARAYAIQEAQKATYRNTTALSEALSRAGNYHGDNKVIKAASFGFNALVPFRKTPANVLTTALDYSPVGIAKAVGTGLSQVVKGEYNAAQFVDNLSEGLTGTAIMALGMYLAAEGILNAQVGGDDEKEKRFLKETGKQDYAINIGGVSYTLDWAAPTAMPMLAGAAIMEAVQNKKDIFPAIMDAVNSSTQVIFETSMLSSLDDFLSGISYAENVAGYAVNRIASSYLGQYIPTIGGKIASAMDPVVRKAYVEPGKGQSAKDVSFFVQGVQKKIPGQREKLQPMIDRWGREVSNGTAGERVFQSFVSPGFMKKDSTDAVDQELMRLNGTTGNGAVFPSSAGKTISGGGKEKTLNAEEYTRYAKDLGETRHHLLEEAIDQPFYQSMSDVDKSEYIGKVYAYAKSHADRTVGIDSGSKWMQNVQSARKDLGVSPSEFIALTQKYGTDSFSGPSYDKLKSVAKTGVPVSDFFRFKSEAASLDQTPYRYKGEWRKPSSTNISKKEVSLWASQNGLSKEQEAALRQSVNSTW